MSNTSDNELTIPSGDPSDKSRVFCDAQPAKYWVIKFAKRGIKVSERRLKELARKYKCYCPYTEPMLLLPEHLDQIFMEEQQCRSNSICEVKLGGSKVRSKNSPKATIIAKARKN